MCKVDIFMGWFYIFFFMLCKFCLVLSVFSAWWGRIVLYLSDFSSKVNFSLKVFLDKKYVERLKNLRFRLQGSFGWINSYIKTNKNNIIDFLFIICPLNLNLLFLLYFFYIKNAINR